jgi:DNA repair protein RadC
MQQHFFSFESGELQKNAADTSSHCSSVQERLATYGSEALDTAEHLGLILGSQKQADALLKHFGSLNLLASASVEELLPFVSRSKALRLVSSLRMGAVVLREERQSLTIDSPLAVAELCSEMRFLDRESLWVVLLNAKQHLIKVATVSQGTVNESLSHPHEIFKPGIVHSAYSFVMVHNLWVAAHKSCYVERGAMCSVTVRTCMGDVLSSVVDPFAHTRRPNGFLLLKAFQSDYAALYSMSDALTGK